jgi:hypothetical protein
VCVSKQFQSIHLDKQIFLTFLLTSLSLYIFTISKCIIYYRICRDVSAETEYISTRSWYRNINFLSLYQVRVITVFTVFRLLTYFVCLYNYEFWLSLCKIVRSSVILLLPLINYLQSENCNDPDLVHAFLKKWWVESDFKAPNLPLSLRLKVSGCHYNSI